MLSILRFGLALMVVMQHIFKYPHVGGFAVQGFFILSGYLMTAVMNSTYGYSAKGIFKFFVNRLLRLYPSYWFVCLMSLFTISIMGEDASREYNSALFLPSNLWATFENVTILFFDFYPSNVVPRLSPPTWALTVELIWYAGIAIGLSRSKLLANIWFITAIIFVFWVAIFQNHSHELRYRSVAGGALPFAIGALIYHYKHDLDKVFAQFDRWQIVILLSVLFFANAFLSPVWSYVINGDAKSHGFAFYTNIVFCALLVAALTSTKHSIDTAWVRILGDLSYPIYLMHWIVAAAVITTLSYFGFYEVKGLSSYNALVFLITLLISIVIGLLIVTYIERPIENIRRKVKNQK